MQAKNYPFPFSERYPLRFLNASLIAGLLAWAGVANGKDHLAVIPVEISGLARAIDGDGLKIGGVRIRLCGIDAREIGKPGGREDRVALSRLVTGKSVRCIPVGHGTPCDGRSGAYSYDRIVGQCFVGDLDLAGEMVRTGHAVDWPRFSGGHYGQ